METTNEQVVAVLPLQQMADKQELSIGAEVKQITAQASSFAISTPEQYAEAAEVGKRIRAQVKTVTEFFKPLKTAADLAHKAVCAREKQMLDPLKKSEATIKTAMSAYTIVQERIRRRQQQEAERLRQQEAERLLNEAATLDSNGDKQQAEQVLAEAQIMAETPVAVSCPTASVKGVSYRTDWTIKVEDPDNVPVSVAGVVIRPVDEAAVMRLVRASKGNVSIPGITIEEVKKTVLRS